MLLQHSKPSPSNMDLKRLAWLHSLARSCNFLRKLVADVNFGWCKFCKSPIKMGKSEKWISLNDFENQTKNKGVKNLICLKQYDTERVDSERKFYVRIVLLDWSTKGVIVDTQGNRIPLIVTRKMEEKQAPYIVSTSGLEYWYITRIYNNDKVRTRGGSSELGSPGHSLSKWS